METNALTEQITSLLDSEKAEEILTFDVSGQSALSDYIIVASSLNKRHTQTLAEKVQLLMKHEYNMMVNSEGGEIGDWILVDCLDVIVHIFQPHVRELYKIEDLWKKRPVRD